jgi:Cu2+-exporting ATPase
MDAGSGVCFHCAEPLPARGVRHALIDGGERALCCAGCEAAAMLIRDAGLLDYYRVRSEPARRADEAPADFLAWDSESVQLAQVRERDGDGTREITVLVEGLRCAACGWLIEHALGREPGVREVQVNPSTGRATLAWDGATTRLSTLLDTLARLGYIAHLPGADGDVAATAQRRTALKRLVVAGLGMMQGMMFAEALYFGDGAMDLATRDFFRWVGLGVSTPVVFYAGWPFLRGAWIEWRQRHPGMDLLVATTILVAWTASLVETLRGGPAVYFDSAVMFVFLLLATRHIEQAARRRANAAVEVLARAQPQQARRVDADRVTEIPVHALRVGDRVRVRPGEAVPADGTLLGTGGAFDEALLSGESRPVAREAGAEALAGSVCLDAPVELMVTRIGSATTLAQMVRLVERAQAARPRIARVADRIASRFVVALFAATVVIACAWYAIDPAQALPIALAVLAVSCPCALSLAVPAGLAATHSRLAREGALVLRPDALETLARVDCVVLDKTGTLTTGRMQVTGVRLLTADLSRARALALGAALERESLHPLASAFRPHAVDTLVARAVRATGGGGVAGRIDGTDWRLGSAAFVGAGDDAGRAVWLADAQGPVARFEVDDELRAGAVAAMAALRERGVALRILSGDAPEAVARIAATLGIEHWQARQSPQDKLAAIRKLQAEGRTVAMVGDGINDAAVLAGASVSVAMAEGAALAHAAADVVLATPRLQVLPSLLAAARDNQRVARQNLSWAVGYNTVGLLLAAVGLVPPWAAAIGMSVSSLAVTLNALRLAASRDKPRRPPAPLPATPAQVPA